jgi:hypothetical protein
MSSGFVQLVQHCPCLLSLLCRDFFSLLLMLFFILLEPAGCWRCSRQLFGCQWHGTLMLKAVTLFHQLDVQSVLAHLDINLFKQL